MQDEMSYQSMLPQHFTPFVLRCSSLFVVKKQYIEKKIQKVRLFNFIVALLDPDWESGSR
jgi:hypothetical protein